MGTEEKSPVSNNPIRRVKVYRMNDDGKWDDQGTGHVTVDYLERSEELVLFVIDEEDNETLLLHRIGSDDIYRKQEDTIISWRDPQYSTELALSFQETTDCSHIWDHICSVQRSQQFNTLNNETYHCVTGDLKQLPGQLPAVELSTLPIILKASRIQPIPESLQSEREAVQNKVTGCAVIANGSNVVGTEQNDIAPACLEKRVEMMHEERENEVGEELFVEVAKTAANDEITTILPRMPETLQIEREMVQLSDKDSSMENVVVQNELNVMRNNMYVTSSEKIFRVETLEKEYRTTETSLSREALVKHFGKKLDDAADTLGVSRSTMKRACRVHGIKKWPFPKRKKFKSPPSSLKHVNGFVQGGDERVPKFGNSEPSCSDPPLMHTMNVVAHTISNITPKQDVGSVTVKATYGVEMIRFRLSFSSRKADLVEKMTQRFPLNDGTFNIKYEDDDGDWILIVCDEDLEECIAISKSKSIIKMLVQPIASQAP